MASAKGRSTPASPPKNRLLAALSGADYKRLQPHLVFVAMSLKDMVYERQKPIRHVYFPESGVISIVTDMNNGSTVEVATVGKEGFVGTPLVLASEHVPSRAFCQVPGSALRMDAAVFLKEFRRNGALATLTLRYTQALINQISQSAACNRVHAIEQRCARWLLMTQDRMSEDSFLLTQEFLAQMLGVRRASVSVAAAILHKVGLITYTRGIITILDRKGLEAAACECYQIIRNDYTGLNGDRPKSPSK